MKRLALALGLVLCALPASAEASPEAPFGHACADKAGVRFCPTASDDQRVPSFDGVPLDVDVTLPPTGTGPFPTIVMLHGFPGTKAAFQAPTADGTSALTYRYNDVFYAAQGYAVVTLSSRGFGRSCGVPDSRTAPQCDRGWVHPVADQRYELRDVQHLLGLLADEGVADPRRLGVTGVSMGGSMTMQLGFLRDRVRNVDGSFAPWTSPGGKALEFVAAHPRWGVSDIEYSLLPNGRALDYVPATKPEGVSPIGVAKETVLKLLAAGGSVGYIAPKGADPTADLNGWLERILAGEPYGADTRAIATQFTTFKGTPGLEPGNAAPLLIQVGWTDPVFPAIEAVRPYQRINLAVEGGADIGIQIGDIGHFTGGNPRGQYRRFNAEADAFFARLLKGQGEAPSPGRVTAYLQGCPKGSQGSAAIQRAGWPELGRGSFALSRRSGRVTSAGGDDATAKVADPGQTGDRCTQVAVPRASRNVTVLTRRSPGFTMLGLPEVTAAVRTSGDNGQIDALLWERLANGRQRIVDFGVYRLRNDQRGRIRFQLQGNGYRFARGSTVRLELRGRTPGLFRPSNGSFSVALSDVRVSIPTHDRPSRSKGIVRPPRRN